MRKRTILSAMTTLVLLAGCSAIGHAPAGRYNVGAAQYTLGRSWSDVSKILPGRTPKVRVLSIDGPLLNRLYVSDALRPGDSLIKRASKETPTPTLRAGMTGQERMEFVADSMSAAGYQRVETSRPRQAPFGQARAVRFDLSARTNDGLDIKGIAQAAEVAGKTYVAIYLAPAEHYYAATVADAEQVIASALPGR